MASWLDAMHSAQATVSGLKVSTAPESSVPKASGVSPSPLKSFSEVMSALNGKGDIKTAGGGIVSGTATDGTGGGILSGLANWFDATRVVTVLLGMILFAAGVFLLGKGPLIETVKDAVK